MAIKFQYNKTSLQNLDKQLKMRTKALPTIKNKEAALRIEVKKAKNKLNDLENKLQKRIEANRNDIEIWNEFDTSLVKIDTIKTSVKKIAGVKIAELEKIIFKEKKYSLLKTPTWFPEGIYILKELITISVKKELYREKMELLNHARRKTTQKVNLYEKVQIPGYEDAIRKIKRFLEDEENLSKSAQKIVKTRQQTESQL